MRRNLELLWNEWEGRLLLINIANQLHAGIIRRRDIDAFLRKAASLGADFSRRARALMDEAPGSGTFRESSLYYIARVKPDGRKNPLLLRVAPMQRILEAVELTGADPASLASRRARALAQLTTLRKIPVTAVDHDNARNAEVLFKSHLFDDGSVGKAFRSWSLPDCLTAMDLAAGNLTVSGVALRAANSVPVFFAPVADKSATSRILGDANNDGLPADLLRDTLGLDHLGSQYKDERVILGFYLVRLRQIENGKALRPTAFDATSPGRFRACYGSFGGAIGRMGHTANLASIPTGQPLEGVREVICGNNQLTNDNQEVLIGYLGPVTDPRADVYVEGRKAMPRDEAFIAACAGSWTMAEVIDTIVGAAP